jgi:Transposase DDE domain
VSTLDAACRHHLSDEQWTLLEPLLPTPARPPAGLAAARVDRRGPVPGPGGLPVARCSDSLRTVVAGVRAVLVLAAARDLDTRRGGADRQRGRRREDGLAGVGGLHHRPRSCARRQRTTRQQRPHRRGTADHALGRSRGGWSTKIHLAVEQQRHVLGFVLTAGRSGDSPQIIQVLETIRVRRPGPGRPRTRPDRGAGRQGRTPHAATVRTYFAAASRKTTHRGPGRPSRPPQGPWRSRRTTTRLRRPWSIATGTPPSSASTPSNTNVHSPPATTSSPSATPPPSASPTSTDGSDDFRDRS